MMIALSAVWRRLGRGLYLYSLEYPIGSSVCPTRQAPISLKISLSKTTLSLLRTVPPNTNVFCRGYDYGEKVEKCG